MMKLTNIETPLILDNIARSLEAGDNNLALSDTGHVSDCMSALKQSFDGKNLDIALKLYEISENILFEGGDISYLRSYIFQPIFSELNKTKPEANSREAVVVGFLSSLLSESAKISSEEVENYRAKAKICLAFVFKNYMQYEADRHFEFSSVTLDILNNIIDELSVHYALKSDTSSVSSAALAALATADDLAAEGKFDPDHSDDNWLLNDDDSGPFRALVPAVPLSSLNPESSKYNDFLKRLSAGKTLAAYTKDETIDYLILIMREQLQEEIIEFNRSHKSNSGSPLTRTAIQEKYAALQLEYIAKIDEIFSSSAPADLQTVEEGWETLAAADSPVIASAKQPEMSHVDFMNALYDEDFSLCDAWTDEQCYDFLENCLDRALEDAIAFNAKQEQAQNLEGVVADFDKGPRMSLKKILNERLAQRRRKRLADKLTKAIGND